MEAPSLARGHVGNECNRGVMQARLLLLQVLCTVCDLERGSCGKFTFYLLFS